MLFTITAVSAADSSTNAVNATLESIDADSDNSLGMQNDVEILGEGETDGGTFAELSSKISGASAGDTVYLWNDYEYSGTDSGSNGIYITKSITIDGQGHKIDAKEQSRIFYISSSSSLDITLKNITFANGKAGWGGAIYWYPQYGGDSHILNCNFINNTGTGTYGGGAIYEYYGITDITSCIFINNYNQANALNLYDTNVVNSIFINNGENIFGGSYVTANYNWFGNTADNITDLPNVESGVTLNNYYVLNMSLDDQGVASVTLNNLYENGGITSSFSNYALPSIKLNVVGKGVEVPDSVTLSNGVGTIVFTPADAYVITVSYNGVELTREIKPTFSMLKDKINSEVNEITLNQDYVYDSVKDSGLTNGIDFAKDMAIDGQGHIIDAKESSNIFYFNDNTDSYSLTLKNIIFANATGTDGAAVYFKGKKIEIINCTFINNAATSQGDAVYVADAKSSENKITESLFTENTGSNSVIYVNLVSASSKLNLNNSILVGNNATYNVKGTSNVIVDYSWLGNTIENYANNNIAKVDGAILNNWLFLKIDATAAITDNAVISLNNLYDDGDVTTYDEYSLKPITFALSGSNARTSVSSITLDDNGQATYQFRMYETTASLTATHEDIATAKELEYTIVDDGSFKALNGIIWFSSANDVIELTHDYVYSESDTMTEGILIPRTITINGNGHKIDAKGETRIFDINRGVSNVNINDVNFVNAKSAYGSSITIQYEADYCNIKNCNFTNSTATSYAGAIECIGDYCTIDNCNFINNSAVSKAGAIRYYHDTQAYIKNSNFINNTVDEGGLGGGAIYDDDGKVSIEKSTFFNNSAKNMLGGVIYSKKAITISDSIILNNTGNYDIYDASGITIQNSWVGNTFDNYDTAPNVYSLSSYYSSWLYLNIKFYGDFAIVSLNNAYAPSSSSSSVYSNYNLPEITLNVNSTTLDLGDINKVTLDCNGQAVIPYTKLSEDAKLTVSNEFVSLTKDCIVGDFDSLQYLIDTATGDTIELTRNYTFIENVDTLINGISITSDITIDGKGHTINGSNLARILYITTNGVTLKNINFVDGYATHGGAIYNNGGSGFKLINCTFENNVAYNNPGGAIYTYSNGVNDFINCTFIGNKMAKANQYGGAVYIYEVSGQNNFIGCAFINNTANYGGAIATASGKAITNIEKSLFITNTANFYSSIYIKGGTSAEFYLKNSIIFSKGLTTDSSTQVYVASSLRAGDVNYNWWMHTNSNYPQNLYVRFSGGGLSVTKYLFLDISCENELATISLNNVYDTSSKTTSVYDGELPQITFDISVVNAIAGSYVTLNENGQGEVDYDLTDQTGSLTATYNSVSISTSLNYDDSFTTLQGKINRALEGSQLFLYHDYNYDATKDAALGEGIVIDRDLTIDGQGHAVDAKNAARIFKINDNTKNIVLKNIKFVNAVADNGAAVYSNCNNIQVINCTFENNEATSNGDALYVIANSCDITESTLINNIGSVSAVYLDSESDDAAFKIENSILVNNGATDVVKAKGSLTADYNWWGNTADNTNDLSDGLAQKWYVLDMTVDDSQAIAAISLNNLNDGVSYENYALPTITLNMQATNGVVRKEKVTLDENGEASVNYIATDVSAGLTAEYNGVSITRSIEYDADADYSFTRLQKILTDAQDNDIINLEHDYEFVDGIDDALTSGIEINNKNLTINGNGYTLDGKGQSTIFKIVLNAHGAAILNTTFINGYTSSYGGAIHMSTDLYNVSISDCTFISNTASNRGGAIYSASHNTTVTNCTFVENHAGNGGAIEIRDDSTVFNCTFIENSANQGGAIYLMGDNVVIDKCLFEKNSASSGTAISTYNSNNGKVTNSIFVKPEGSTVDFIMLRSSSSLEAEDNWWGNTFDDLSSPTNVGVSIDSYLLLAAEHDNYVLVGENSNVKFVFKVFKSSSISNYDTSKVHDMDLSLTTTTGEVNKETALVGENILFKANNFGSVSLTADAYYSSYTVDLTAKYPIIITAVDSITVHVCETLVYNIEYNPKDPVNQWAIVCDDYNVVDAGYNVASITGISVGTANLTVKVLLKDGYDDYASTTVIIPVTVIKNIPEIKINNPMPISVDADGTVAIDVKPEDMTIKFSSNDTSVATVDEDTGVVTGLKEGKVNITVRVIEDGKYESGCVNVTVEVQKTQTSIDPIDEIPTTYNQQIQITPSVVTQYGDVSDGTVKYYIGETAISDDKSLGETFTWTVDRAGKFNITAKYCGSDKYLTCEKNITVTAAKADTPATVEVTSETYGTPSTVTVNSIVSGEYTINVNGTEVKVTIQEGQTTGQTTHVFGANSYSANITRVPESDIYNVLTQNSKFIITKATNAVTISSDGVTYPNEVTITLTAEIAGTYNVKINDTLSYTFEVTSNGGSAEFKGLLDADTYEPELVGYEHANYTASVTSPGFTVSKGTNNIQITVDASKAYPNNITVNVKADVPDTYIISVNDGEYTIPVVVDSTGSASYKVSAGKNYLATTSWSNRNYDVVLTSATFDVEKGDINLRITIDSPVENGTNVTGWVITDVPGTYIVSVQGYDDVEVVVTGTQKLFDLGKLPINNYRASVSIPESANYNEVSNYTDFAVKVSTTPFTVTSDKQTYVYGEKIKISYGNLPNEATGKVILRFTDDQTSSIAELVVGVESEYVFTVPLNVKEYSITAKFESTNPLIDDAVRTVGFDVEKAENKIKVEVTPSTHPDNVTIRLNATVAGTYSVDINGTVYDVVANDTAGRSVYLAPGNYYANITYSDRNYYGVTTNDTFTVNKADNKIEVFAESVDYPGEVNVRITADIDGTYDVDINGTTKQIVANDPRGISLRLAAGSYYANITYSSPYYNGITTNKTFTVRKAFNVVAISVDDKTLPGDVSVNVAATVPGIYTININGSAVNVEVKDDRQGSNTLHLKEGKNYVATTAFENENYTTLVIGDSFDVNKAINNVQVIVENIDDLTVNVKVIADIDATYNVDINGSVREISANGEGIVLKLAAGDYYANITGYQDDDYEAMADNAAFTVKKIASGIDVDKKSFDVDAKKTETINIVNVPEDYDGSITFESSNQTVAAVDVNGKVTGNISGETIIRVKFSGSQNYTDGNIDVTVTVNKISPQINADPFNIDAKESKDIEITKPDDYDGKITYESSDDSIASVDGEGKVTGLKNGTVTITISAAGTDVYEQQSCTVKVTVKRASAQISVKEPEFDIDADENKTIEVTKPADFNGKVTFESNDTGIVAVNSTTGEVTAIKAGKAKITVKATGSDVYEDETVDVTVIVNKIDFSFTADDLIILIDQSEGIAVNNPEDYPYQSIEFTSSDDSIAIVENGKVTGLKNGTVTVTIKASGSEKFNDNQTDITVTVNKIPSIIEVFTTQHEINVREDLDILAFVNGEEKPLIFVSSDESIASVNGNTITGVKGGKVNITIRFEGDEKYLENETEFEITVNKLSFEIYADEDSYDVDVNGNQKITLHQSSEDYDGNITITSSDESIATVDGDCKVTGLKEGKVTITITATNSSVYEDGFAQVNVTVNRISAHIKVDSSLDINAGETGEIELTTDFDGKITFSSSDSSVVSVDENGVIKALKGGSAIITVKANESEKYMDDSVEISVNVEKLPSDITLDVFNSTVAENTTAFITITDNGIVNITIQKGQDVIKTENVSVSNYFKYTAGLSNGTYTITAHYYGNDQYMENTVSKEFTVKLIDKFEFEVSVRDTVIGQTANATISLPDGASGKIRIGKDEYDLASVIELPIQTAAGKNNLTVEFIPDGSSLYDMAKTTAIYNVAKKDATVSIKADDVKTGEMSAVNVNITDGASGIVIIDVNGTEYSISLSDKKSADVKFDKAGTYNVSARYLGDDEYNPADSEVISVVVTDKLPADIIVQIPENIRVGQNITLNVSCESDGEIEVMINGIKQTIKDGKINYAVGEEGMYSLIAHVNETAEYKAGEGSGSFVAFKNDASIEIILPENIEIGKDIVIGIRSYEGADVIVYIDGEKQTVADGKLTVKAASGTHTVTASVGETQMFTKASANVTYDVAKKASAIAVNGTDVKAGEKTVISINVTDGASGNIIISINGTEYSIALPDNTLTVVLDKAGKYDVSARYLGDDIFNSAQSDVISLEAQEKQTPEIAIDIPQIKAGETGEITVTVPNATGEVSITVDGDKKSIPLDENGSAKYALDKISAGEHIITVSYGGDGENAKAFESTTFEVAKKSGDVKVEVGEIKVGENTTVDINIPDADGNITVIVDGATKTIPLVDGKAQYNISDLGPGKHNVVVIYSGDETHSSAFVSEVIDSPIVKSEFKDMALSGKGVIEATLIDGNGNPLKNATVSYAINGVKSSARTNDKGVVVINASSNSVVEISYAGDDTVLPIETNITIGNIAPQRLSTEIIGDNYTQPAIEYYGGERGGYFKVKLVDSNGKAVVNRTVLIGYNGKCLERVTDENGYASVQINLVAENRLTFAVAFLGDEQYDSTMSVYLITITKKSMSISAPAKTFKSTAKTKSYTVTLKTDKNPFDGKTYLSSGKKVTLKVNGVTYTAKTNSKGQATFKLSITKKGTFAAEINYAGDNTYKSAKATTKIIIK